MSDKKNVKDFHVYLPLDVASKIKMLAAQECRSVSAQIAYLLSKVLAEITP